VKSFVEQFDKLIEPLHKIWAPDGWKWDMTIVLRRENYQEV
jgi:hypothetical protein